MNATQEPIGRKVLVAEDSSITLDLLKLLLNHRGHQVDIATDGLQALEALRKQHYDVALLDFHLPIMDGLQVAATIKAEANGRRLPTLVAITGDTEGLLSDGRDCENFDHILPKPLDIYQVGKVVEEQAAIADRQPALEKIARGRRLPAENGTLPSFLEGRGRELLTWPGDLGATRLSSRAMQATLGDPRFDAILIKEPVSAQDLASIWTHKALYALPVIDLTGKLGAMADLDGSKLDAHETDRIDGLISRFQDRRARLHRDLLFSDDLREQVLARAFVSGEPLNAAFDPASRTGVSYNVTLGPATVAGEAEHLCNEGLLKRKFFDRFHVCSRCDSTRLHVREECTECRSSNLAEEAYMHHFACAYQGPESEFRRGSDLICPKCRRELSHFGFDYDRPGMMIVCSSCSHSASEPAVGFVCLDCCTHADSDSCRTRDTFSYQLTEQGAAFAEHGHAFLGQARRALRFAELPIELIVALNAAAKKYNEERTPFTLLNIFYENEREITAAHGARKFAEARTLFLENLRAALRATDMMIKGRSYDFALLRDIGSDQSQKEFDRLRERAQSTVRFDFGAQFRAFGPEHFS